jgi:WD40 repeat protein
MTGSVPIRPYRGLAPFDDSPLDATLFFGREREREIIVANLFASRLTVLYGQSGVGKTSLLRAGVMQQLRSVEDAAVLMFSSWTDDRTPELDDALAAAHGRDVYLLLDQIEEYFLYHNHDDGLARRLPEILASPGLRVNVLFGVREDALAKLDFFKGHIPNLFSNYLRLDHLDRTAARAAILGPLRRLGELGGRRFGAEPELVEAVLDQVATGRIEYGLAGRGVARGRDGPARIEAPFLQLVLERLWEVEQQAGSSTLRLETLERLGGAQTIVREHLNGALEQLDSADRALAAEVFEHLVTPSGTKIAHGVGDLAGYARADRDDLDAVLTLLSRERIVRRVDDSGGESRYEIFHDVLAAGVLAWRSGYDAERALELERGRRRRAVAIAAASLFALAAVAAVALFALAQRERAQEEATTARARERAARALSLITVDPQRSLELAIASAEDEQTEQIEDVLRSSLDASRQRRVMVADPDAAVVAFDRRGRVLVPYESTLRAYAVARPAAPERVLALDGRLLAISEDARLAAIGDGRRLLVRSTDDGRIVQRVEFTGPVRVARFDSDAERVAVVAANRSGQEFASVVRVADGARTHVFRHRGTKSVAFSRDGRLLATGSADDSARVWRLADAKQLRSFPEHAGDVRAVAFSPDGTLLATGSADSGVRIWRLADGERRFLFVGHNNPTVAVAWSPDGAVVADASLDRTSRILDIGGVAAGRTAATLIGHQAGVSAIAYSRDGRRLVTVGLDGTARVWDARAEHELLALARHRGGAHGAVFDPRSRAVLSWGSAGAKLTDLDAPGRSRVVAVGEVTDAAFARTGRRFATVGPSDALLHGETTKALPHRRPAVDVEFTPDGRVVTASGDAWARVFDADGRLLSHLDHGEPVSRVATGVGGAIVTATVGGTIRFWRGGVVAVATGHDGAVGALEVSPDGLTVASGGADGFVRVWDAATGALRHELGGHVGGATDVAFSPSGSTIVTTDAGRNVRVVDVASGTVLRDLIGHFGPVNSAAFRPDGRWIVTTSAVAAALWQAGRTSPFAYLRGHVAPVVRSASFSPDGRHIVSAGDDGTVRVYRCALCGDLHDLVALARARLAAAALTR